MNVRVERFQSVPMQRNHSIDVDTLDSYTGKDGVGTKEQCSCPSAFLVCMPTVPEIKQLHRIVKYCGRVEVRSESEGHEANERRRHENRMQAE